MNKRQFGGILFAGASVIAMASVAHAQAPAAAGAAPAVLDEVVITGSRTIKNGNSSPSPVTVVSTQDILNVQPGTLSDALESMPVFAGSRSTTSNPTVNGSQTGGNSNSNQLNLRNIGVIRTLVLMDGNRIPPTAFNNAVDVDVIPQMLVQRVDVVTGGVSAVYGSDAVAGVVNYILDKKFTGLRFDADTGVSQRGDARRYEAGFAVGQNFADGTGHVEASYQYIDEGGILSRSARPWLFGWGVSGAGTTANPYTLNNNVRQSGFPVGGLITGAATAANPLGLQTFDSNGVLRPFVNGVATGTAALQLGGDGGTYNSMLMAPERAHQIFARYDQDLGHDIHAHVQIGGDLKRNDVWADSIKLSNVTMQSNNAFLPSVYQAQLAAAKQTTFKYSQLMDDFSRYHAVADSRQWIYQAGLNGSLAGYSWDANYTRGETQIETLIENNPNSQRLAASLDAVVNPANGQIVCQASLTNSAYSNCVPINVFGPSAQSAAALAYIAPPTHYKANTVQDDFSGHIAGSPFALPAGPVNVALSGEWRKLSFTAVTDAGALAFDDCTSIRTNCAPTTGVWGFSFANEPKVSQTVQEVAFEATAPLIKDQPFIKELNVNGAVRYTSYNTSGNYVTWKIGGDWRLNDALRFRGTVSKDIRAPTLYELFAPVNSVPVNPVDLLTNTSPSVPSTDLSNPKLAAEIGNTDTAGVVWNPMPGLSFSLDAYRIVIDNAIVQGIGSTPAYQNLCYASGGASIWCTLQGRPLGNYTNTSAANAVNHWYTLYQNIAQVETYGADLEANYSTRIGDHNATFRVMSAYQPHAYYRAPGVPTVDQGGVAFGPTGYSAGAAWRLSALAHFQATDKFAIDVQERYRNAMKLGGDPSQVWVNNSMPAFYTTNATFSYTTRTELGQTQLSFNVANLFDAHAPGGGYSGNGTRAGLRDGFAPGDDVVGRAFTLALKVRR